MTEVTLKQGHFRKNFHDGSYLKTRSLP